MANRKHSPDTILVSEPTRGNGRGLRHLIAMLEARERDKDGGGQERFWLLSKHRILRTVVAAQDVRGQDAPNVPTAEAFIP